MRWPLGIFGACSTRLRDGISFAPAMLGTGFSRDGGTTCSTAFTWQFEARLASLPDMPGSRVYRGSRPTLEGTIRGEGLRSEGYGGRGYGGRG